ncbi:MAG: hypothetical protein Q9217_006361 [Psora testacea]
MSSRPRTRGRRKLGQRSRGAAEVQGPSRYPAGSTAIYDKPLIAAYKQIRAPLAIPDQEEQTNKSKQPLDIGRVRTNTRANLSPKELETAPEKLLKQLRRPRDAITAEHPQREGTAAQEHSTYVDRWLDQVEPVRPEEVDQAQTASTSPNMESSSVSKNTGENVSTVKAGSKTLKVTDGKLRLRRVNRKPTTDDMMEHLKSIILIELPERTLRETQELQRIAQGFLQMVADHPDDSCYSYLDDFSFKFDEGKSKINFPIVNDKYFQADLERCLAKNEAVLQRTIMIHTINRYWMGNIFDWNCEGQCDDDIKQPKPDLAISFTLESFTGGEDDSDPYPPDLEKSLSPDGDAYLANLNNASQALNNMYLWMARVQKQQEFFKAVRVFSFVFNAQDLNLRVHRASQLADGNLCFRFDQFSPLNGYTRDQACMLIRTLLTNYGSGELHPLLKDTFVETVKQEVERVQIKRKLIRHETTTQQNRREENS